MFKTTAVNSLAAVAAAALVAGLMVFPAAIVPAANAQVLAQVVVHEPALPLETHIGGVPCALQAWPYYERNCRFDLREPTLNMPAVRVIALR